MGYVMLSVLVVIWWLFQLAVIESLTAFSALLERYSRSRLRKKINAYKSDNPFIGDKNVKGQYIRITWWYDLVQATPFLERTSTTFRCVRVQRQSYMEATWIR